MAESPKPEAKSDPEAPKGSRGFIGTSATSSTSVTSSTGDTPSAGARRKPSLTGAFSVEVSSPQPTATPRLVADVKPLTQEDLSAYWQEAATALGLEELLTAGVPRLGEKPGTIEIDAQSVAFHDEFRPHRISVMEFLREKTGMRMLDCHVNPMFISQEELVYAPENKYKTMLESNPAMLEMRRLFPDIDH